jgi:RNA polymerase sigma factor (TIGR02999 family)
MNDLVGRLCRINRDRIGRGFESGKLAWQQRGPGKMSGAAREPTAERLRIGLQVHETDPAEIASQGLPIPLLQSGAGQNQRLTAIRGRGDNLVQRRNPRRAVRVGQRYRGAHLLDGCRRVQFVALDKAPAGLGRERPADGRLAGPRHAHHDDHHVRSIGQNMEIMGAGHDTRLMSSDHPQSPPPARDLAPIVYDELRRLAAAYMRRERPGQTIQATALVHEAYMRLAGAGTPWHDERHFVGIAARSMRQILVERARARGAQKRWGGLNRVSITDALAVASEPVAMLPALDDALTRLEAIDPEQARIVELRYFAGLSIEDTADALGMSPATLKRRFALARAWLFRELSAT